MNLKDESIHEQFVIKVKEPLPASKWLFMLCWIQYTVIYWSCIILNRVPFFIYITPYIFPTLLLVSLYAWLKSADYKMDLWNFIILFITMAFWFLSKIFHPEYQTYFDQNAERCLQAFLMIYVGKSVFRDGFSEDEYSWLVAFSKWGVVFTSLYFLYGGLTGRVANEEYMTISYRMLPSTLCVTSAFLKDAKLKNILWFFGSFMIQMFMGTRGAVLAIVVFIVLYLFLFAERKVFFIVLGISGIYLLLDFTFDITTLLLHGILELCETLHMSSRIIEAFLESNLTDDNGRDIIHTFVLNRIGDNIWLGDGIFADRYYLETMFDGGMYVHNIILELWTDFGLIPAIVIMTSIVILSFKLMLNKDLPQQARLLLGIGASAAITQLMFTGSYLTDAPFWLMLGMLWGIKKYKKSIKRS